MAEETAVAKEKTPTRKIKVKNIGPKGHRLVFDVHLKQHLLAPGQEAEVEIAEPEAKRMEEASKAGSEIHVAGHDHAPPAKPAGPPPPKEHESRAALAEKEAEVMAAGQEADKQRAEQDAKKSGAQLAAETGIHMHAVGEKPEVVTAPADAPPKKKPA